MPESMHGGDIYSYEREYGEKPLDFSSNINPLRMQKAVLAALCEAAIHADCYPDPHSTSLCRKLAQFEQVAQDWVLCSGGAADLIYRIVYAYRPKRALLLAPSFSEYEAALRAGKCRIQFARLEATEQFQLTEAFLEELTSGYDILFLCNPNNPTGQIIPANLMEKIVKKCRENQILLVVDECFLDFSEHFQELTVKKYLQNNPYLIVLKAFTKTFALAGARLGYILCSNRDLLEQIAAAGQPWPVSTLAQAAGEAALQNAAEYLEKTRKYLKREREFLRYGLTCCGYKVFESHANYLFFLAQDTQIVQKMRQEGILIRGCENYRGLGPGYYRIAIRRHEDNIKLLGAFERI